MTREIDTGEPIFGPQDKEPTVAEIKARAERILQDAGLSNREILGLEIVKLRKELDEANAKLARLREPDEAMVEAVKAAVQLAYFSDGECVHWGDVARAALRAAAAVIEGKPTGQASNKAPSPPDDAAQARGSPARRP